MSARDSDNRSKIEKKAQQDIPGLDLRVRNLLNLAVDILNNCKSPHEEDHFGLMAQCFLKRQIEHTRSLLLLLDNKREIDAQLIARSMMEGLAQLIWTAKDFQKRALRWRSYSYVERWRILQRRRLSNEAVDNKELLHMKAGLAQYGKMHMTGKALKNLKKNSPLPEDPYHRRWTGNVSIREIYDEVEGELIYLNLYTSLSAWHHWSPGALARMIAAKENRITYKIGSPATIATALANTFQCLWHTAVSVNAHLQLNYDQRLARIHKECITWYDKQPKH